MKTFTALVALWLAATCPLGHAFGGEVQCPPTIAVDQKVTDAPAGWTAGYNGFTNELDSVTIYDGPPEQGASLVYSDEKTVADSVTQTWQLAPTDRGNFITCGYSNTSAQLTQKIPAAATRCEVTFERNVSFRDGRHPVRKAICTSTDPPAARQG
jgi:hypothetical protein